MGTWFGCQSDQAVPPLIMGAWRAGWVGYV